LGGKDVPSVEEIRNINIYSINLSKKWIFISSSIIPPQNGLAKMSPAPNPVTCPPEPVA
jgi:hypothetical protein